MNLLYFFQELECMLKWKIQTIRRFCHVSTALKVYIYQNTCAWQSIVDFKCVFYFRRQIPFHITFAWWAHHLLVLEHITMVQWITIASPFRHSSRRTCCWLRSSGPERKAHRIAIAYPSITQPSGSNHQRAELPTSKYHRICQKCIQNDFVNYVNINCNSLLFTPFLVSRGAFPSNEREYKQASIVVVTCSSYRSSRNGLLADAPSQDILRNEKTSIIYLMCLIMEFCDYFVIHLNT